MGSWAKVAGAAAPKRTVAVTTVPEGITIVVDANAIISGLQLDRLGGTAVTVPAVLTEVRDAVSRQRLATLPLGLTILHPTDEAMTSVRNFATLTGDVAVLSAVDMQLLALTRDLTLQRHGAGALRDAPPPPKMQSRSVKHQVELPGWGEDNEEWAALDAQPDTPSAKQQGSRILSSGSQLVPESSSAPTDSCQPLTDAALDAVHSKDTSNGLSADDSCRASANTAHDARSNKDISHIHLNQGVADVVCADGGEGERQVAPGDEGDEGGWEVAASSRNAFRRKKRKEVKRQLRSQAVAPSTPDRQPDCKRNDAGHNAIPSPQTIQCSASADDRTVDIASAMTSLAVDCGPLNSGTALGQHGQNHKNDAEGQHGLQLPDDGSQDEETDTESEEGDAEELKVKIVTADFAMQNVALQMGMCLSTPDGLRIRRLSRWALRCTACMAVTHEHGRLFCPQCGNNALQRVHVVVHADGSETYGVRKNHVLKGTRFPLPAPKGGRNSRNPVLCEDVLMQQAARIKRMSKQKEPAVDPFAPEYGEDTWLRPHRTNTVAATQQFQLAQAANMTALLASHKHNPNERSKANRSSRRK